MKHNRIVCCVLAAALLLCAMPAAAEQDAVVTIRTTDELLTFAQSCTLNTWSQGKTVSLEADLSLEGLDFCGIPSFGGTFLGNGHIVSDWTWSGEESPIGFFRVLQETAFVENLHIRAVLDAETSGYEIGGIAGVNAGTIENCTFFGSIRANTAVGGVAGINTESGKILNCVTTGVLYGENQAGGIAGIHYGEIGTCRNRMYVNTEYRDADLSIMELINSFSFDLSFLLDRESTFLASDTGGIAGYSEGTIRNSTNCAEVGYPHVGYNVGGIAGRSAGWITDCANEAAIYGRKDVGGIVGQAEPHVRLVPDSDTLSKLETLCDELNERIDLSLSDCGEGTETVIDHLQIMSAHLRDASEAIKTIRVSGSIKATVTGGVSASGSASGSGSLPDVGAGAGIAGIGGVSVGGGTVAGGGAIGAGVGGSLGDAFGSVSGSGSVTGSANAGASVGMTVSLKDVSAALVKLSEEFGLASAAAGDLSEKLTKDLLAVNEKISELYTAVFDAALTDPAERISDVSEAMLSEMREGKIASCQNSGSITGDVNVGGIAGTMGFESLLDPENDLESAFTLLRDNLYEYRAALSGCRNVGRVSAKRSYAGGVCGKMTIGIIDDSINYGAVASETGSYVGGIAGLTQAKVHGSFAKCTVSGKSYIGGIVGSGYTDSTEQSGSLVSDCVAVVSVSADGQFAGTVAGGTDGLYRANRYLIDELGGINGIGYAEQAEPISYRSLQTLSELPIDFSALTVTFVADGRTVKTVSVGYGDSLFADSFPPVPYQQDSYGRWDRMALEGITRDTVVTALYYPYETALASDAVRADGRPVFFAQGLFSDTDVLLAEPMPQQTELFPVLIGNGEAAIREYLSCFSQGTLPQAEIGFLLREQWRLTLPEDGSASHTVRMTLPDAQTEHLRFYEKHDGTWTQIPYTAIGQYAVLNLSSANSEVAVLSTKSVVWVWFLLLSLLAGILFLLIFLLIRLTKRLRARKSPAPSAPPHNNKNHGLPPNP